MYAWYVGEETVLENAQMNQIRLFSYDLNRYHFNLYSTAMGTDFRRRNLASIDVRLCRLKAIPALKE